MINTIESGAVFKEMADVASNARFDVPREDATDCNPVLILAGLGACTRLVPPNLTKTMHLHHKQANESLGNTSNKNDGEQKPKDEITEVSLGSFFNIPQSPLPKLRDTILFICGCHGIHAS